MSRVAREYGARGSRQIVVEGAVDVSEPVGGYYRAKLRGRSVLVGVHLWYGPPHDPVTGEVMDRSWRWQAEANGEPVDLDHVWPACADDPISEADYQFYAKRQRWAEANMPDTPFADPRRAYNPLTAPLPF